jgi:hypothetical protein
VPLIALAEPEPVVPAVEVPAVVAPLPLPVAPPDSLPIRAFVSTNAGPLPLVADELDEPVAVPAVLPVVPTAPPIWLPCCRHPLIVIVSALLLLVRLACEPVGSVAELLVD